MTTTAAAYKDGLEDIIAARSAICRVDGEAGRLYYRGYEIADLVGAASFEDTTRLLWVGELPSAAERAEFAARLAETRALPPPVLDLLRRLPRECYPLDALRTAVSLAAASDPDVHSDEPAANLRKAYRLMNLVPATVAAWQRIRTGREPVAARAGGSHAANFLYMLDGTEPSAEVARILDVILTLHADHEFNASTFAARVTAATLSDVHSAVVSGIGALKGPLHGGANEQVMLMVEKIKDPAKADAWIHKALTDKARIMGFGHRVYRVEDPRAKHLKRLALELGQQVGDTSKVQILDTVVRVVGAEKHIFPNVDLYSGAAYAAMGISTDQFTPIFAMSRIAGWTAHVLEQHGNNRLIRPRSDYTGAIDLKYVPLSER
jgi:citrate synthase